jgi:drug/metabolite transporter (DMT)-like permease
MHATATRGRVRTGVALGAVYLAWGGTYPAIRVLVGDVPPLLGTAARFALAAALLLGWLAVRGVPRAPGRKLAAAAVIGTVILGDIGILAVAERRVPAGLAALVIASVPLWVVLVRATLGDRPGRRALLAVAAGFAGIALLVLPGGSAVGASGAWLLVLVGAALIEAMGEVASQRVDLPDDGRLSTVVQLGAAAAVLAVAGLVAGEAGRFDPGALTWASAGAFAYLVVPGSLVAYGAFVWLLARVPVTTVSTYAYVNPVVAVAAGALLLGEVVTPTVLAGAVVVLGSVAVLVSARA